MTDQEMKERTKKMSSKIFYGFADIYGGGAFVVISTFFTVFLTKALGMPPALAGTIPLIGKVWDAVTDPMMGNIADRTRSRFGAKRFYMMLGSIISAVTFILLWIPYTGAAQYGFYVLMYILFSTGFTVVMVPYNGLLPEMVDEYTERAKFSGVRMVFSSFGAILAGLLPTLMIKDNTDATQYFRVAMIFGAIFIVVILITFAGTWEKQHEAKKMTMGETFTQSFTVYKNRSFKLFLCIFVFGQCAADFVTGMAVYYVDDVLNAYGGGNFTILMGVILIAQLMGMILFGVIMSKTSKKFPILLATPIRAIATLAMLAFSYEGANFQIILGLSFVIGLGMAATSTSIYAILSDMADVDELITGISRAGTVSGMATFIRKIATGLSSFVIGVLLAIVQYDETIAEMGLRQTADVQAGIAHIYVFSQIVLLIITYIVTIAFPMGKEEFHVVVKEIARRKGEDTSVATEEEKRICERVTGFAYEKLWDRNNALKFSNK